jgi:hypothetical protein
VLVKPKLPVPFVAKKRALTLKYREFKKGESLD